MESPLPLFLVPLQIYSKLIRCHEKVGEITKIGSNRKMRVLIAVWAWEKVGVLLGRLGLE